jgi:uncharacterized protein YkwD
MIRLLTAGTLIGSAILIATAAPALACPGANRTPAQLTVKEARASVVCLINQRRKHNGLRKVRPDRRLERAAQRHSRSMDAYNFFDHESPGGSDPVSRIQATGYLAGARSWAVGENIRWGSGGLGTPRVAVEEWMASSSHRRVMLSGRYREIGIGVAIGSPVGGPGNDAAIYTADFGFAR